MALGTRAIWARSGAGSLQYLLFCHPRLSRQLPLREVGCGPMLMGKSRCGHARLHNVAMDPPCSGSNGRSVIMFLSWQSGRGTQFPRVAVNAPPIPVSPRPVLIPQESSVQTASESRLK